MPLSRDQVRILALATLTLLAAVLALVFTGPANKAQKSDPAPPPSLPSAFARADEVTADIRSGSKDIVRVIGRSADLRGRLGNDSRIVADHGSFLVVTGDERSLRARGFETQRLETTVHLPNGKFDPVVSPPGFTVAANTPAASRGEKRYFIVQFGGITTDEWLESLRSAGLEIVQYIPHQAFIVFGDDESASLAAGHSRVRWVGRHMPEHKTDRFTRGHEMRSESGTSVFEIAVFSRAELEAVAWEFRNKVNGRILSRSVLPNNFFNVLRVEVPVGELDALAAIRDVFRIDPYIPPATEDERAAQIISGNFSNVTAIDPPGYDPLTQFGADGTGVTVAMVDDGVAVPGEGGFYVTANNTIDGPLRGAPPGASTGHGHINAGIVSGDSPFGNLDPAGYNFGRGVAPRSHIINIPFVTQTYTGSYLDTVNDPLSMNGPNGVPATIANNSWGSGTNDNSYGALEAAYDGLVRDGSAMPSIDPVTIIFSAGNSGPAALSLTRPKVSKNTISVANSENVRPAYAGFPSTSVMDNMDDLTSTSSRGPAADGRIKPDITAPGTVITGGRAGGCLHGCIDAHHFFSSGTSHAAPQVSGAAALFTHYWRTRHSGATPSPAMVKAAILLSGQEMNGNITSSASVPNGNEGWGRINMRMMMNTGVRMEYVDQSTVFSNPGDAFSYNGTIADSTRPFRVALVWTDPPGAGNPALVNNLDLTVTVGSTVYRGNVFTNGNSTPGGSGNTIDNVEQVRLPAGIAAGTPVNVTVTATSLNGDGVLGDADLTDQHFALVVYNIGDPVGVPATRAAFDFDGDGKTDISTYRPSAGQWWYLRSSDGGNRAFQFGSATDLIVPADYTGDGRTDQAFYRDGQWFVLRSEDFSFFSFPFGNSTDIPSPADFDGDGRADAAVFRPSTGQWYVQRSTGGVTITNFGSAGDRPVAADYDGDGRADPAIFRPSNGQWWLNRSTAGIVAMTFGTSTDKAVPADYTGDGKADVALYRGGTWFVLRSEDLSFYSFPFGNLTDVPAPGDYDGDGKTDAAVFRPSETNWYVQRTGLGVLIRQFGAATDLAVPNAYVR